jgi:hypothetical protein
MTLFGIRESPISVELINAKVFQQVLVRGTDLGTSLIPHLFVLLVCTGIPFP